MSTHISKLKRRVSAKASKARGREIVPPPTSTKLIQAAAEVFAEVGYEAATVREICRRAGANVAAVNYHFGDKLGLYTEVLRSMRAVQHEAVRRVLEQDGAHEEILKQAIRTMVHNVCGADQSELRFRLMAHELARPTPALTRIIDEARPMYNQLRKLIGKILGLPFNHYKTRLCAHSIIGQIVHYAQARPFLARLWPELKMTPEQTEQIANHIAEFSLAYLRAANSTRGGARGRLSRGEAKKQR